MPPVYSEAVYRMVSKWTETTRIEFVQDAKRAGTKSYDRYQSYSKARCIGEALRLGAKPEDLLHDYHKKYLKTARDQRVKVPAGIVGEEEKVIFNKFLKRMRGPKDCNLRRLEAKKAKALERLTKLGIDFKDMRGEKNCQETNDLQALRLAADCAAGDILAEVEATGRKVTDKDVLTILDSWAFRKNESRLNVLPEGKQWVNSDTLGLIKDRKGTHIVTTPTKDYPSFMSLLNRWLADRRPAELSSDFPFTTISLNYGYAAKRHRDSGNIGPSMIRAFGKFKGGRLCYWPDDDKALPVEGLRDEDKVALDISQGIALFDGNRAHEVESFQGERYSLVFFSVGKYWKAKTEDLDMLRERGFCIPTEATMAMARTLLPPPRGYQQSQSLTSMFGIREKPKVYLWPEGLAGESSSNKPAAAPAQKGSSVQEPSQKCGSLKALFGAAGVAADRADDAPAAERSQEEQGGAEQAEAAPVAQKQDPPQKNGNLKAFLFGGGAADAARAGAPAEMSKDGERSEGGEPQQQEEAQQEQKKQEAEATHEQGSDRSHGSGEEGGAAEQEVPAQPMQAEEAAESGAAARSSSTPPRREALARGGKRMLEASGTKAKRAKGGEARHPSSKAEASKTAAKAATAAREGEEEASGGEASGPAAEELASPQFCPEAAPQRAEWCERLNALARALEAAEARPEAPTVALSNLLRTQLHSSTEPKAALHATMELLLPAAPLPEQALAAAVAQAFGGTAPAADTDLAAVIAQRCCANGTLTAGRPPLTLAAVLEAREAALAEPGQAAAAKRLAGPLLATRGASEAGVLARLLLGRPGLPRPAVLRALAHAFILTRPPRGVQGVAGGAQPAERRAFASSEGRHASLVAMDKALALAYGETNGCLEHLLSALLADCRPAELYSRCGPRCGTPILLMRAVERADMEAVLAELTGSAVLVEQRYPGQRVQVHKSTDESLAIFDSNGGAVTATALGEASLAALRGALGQVRDCVVEAVLQRDSPEYPGGVLWVFDCLWLDGRAMVRQSLQVRRQALTRAVRPYSTVQLPPSEEFSLEDPPTAEVLASFLEDAAACGSTGVMLKRLEREYEAGCTSTAFLAALRPSA